MVFNKQSRFEKKNWRTILSTLFMMTITPPLLANVRYLEPGCYHAFGLEAYHLKYRETIYHNLFFMSFKGQMYGGFYHFIFQPENTGLRFRLDGSATYGSHLHYHSLRTGDSKDVPFRIFEGRVLIGHAAAFGNQWILEEYFGLGIRFLGNDTSKLTSTTGHHGFYRSLRYYYVPIGIRIIQELENDAKWITSLEYDWFLSGLVRNNMRMTTGMTTKQRQSRGYGARIGIDLHIPSSTDCLNYTVGVFVRYWDIQKSTVDRGWYEPKNTTKELGVRIGIIF